MVVTAGQAAAPVACPACGRIAGPQDNFCEACRTELTAVAVSGGQPGHVAACPFCPADDPAAQVSPDGFCESCGRKVPLNRDHTELDLGLLAGVTDRGLRHRRNEDAMALATAQLESGPVALAVVCDGVSTSARPDQASVAAAKAAAEVLLAGVRGGQDPEAASARAVRAAQEAVSRLAGRPADAASGDVPPQGAPAGDAPAGDVPAGDVPAGDVPAGDVPAGDAPAGDAPAGDAPAATFVSAVMTGDAVTLCWLGDSRGYWLGTGPDAVARRLTTDDSLAEEIVAAGLASEADALALPQAHVVTRWVGADLADAVPHIIRFEPPGPGVLLLCSDGLWNYQPGAAELAGLALPAALTDPLGAAATLVRFALGAGGMDNVTVVLAPFPPGRAAPGPPVPADPARPAPGSPVPADPARPAPGSPVPADPTRGENDDESA